MGLIERPLFRLNWFFRPSSSVRTAMLALHPGGALHGTHTLWCGGSLIAFSGRSSIRSGISSSSSAVTESPPASPVTSSSSSSPDPTPSSASLSLGGNCSSSLLPSPARASPSAASTKAFAPSPAPPPMNGKTAESCPPPAPWLPPPIAPLPGTLSACCPSSSFW